MIQVTLLILEGVNKHKFSVDSQILSEFTSKVGESLTNFCKENKTGVHVKEIINICKNLIKLRKSLLHVMEIIPYIV